MPIMCKLAAGALPQIPLEGAYSTLTDPLAGFKGAYL